MTVDLRDLFYVLFGTAFLLLTFAPALSRSRLYNLPLICTGGGFLAVTFGLPLISPLHNDPAETKIIEHASELIVIISLAGAGLAIDTPASWRAWQPTWRLLLFVMPASIVALVWLGVAWGGLSIAAAVLLGAALAPTDPVLARSVAVGPPGEDEHGVKLALTAEAGLNDGLAFPFVWLAIAFAGLEVANPFAHPGEWLGTWLWRDVAWRTAAGVGVGLGSGYLLSRLVFSRIGDAGHGAEGAENPALNFLAWTFIAYGIAEAIDGYGFLAVFLSARAGRAHARDLEGPDPKYGRKAHEYGDQIEAILLVLLLLWLGGFVADGLWRSWSLADLGIALALVFVVRPLAGLAVLALPGSGGSWPDRLRIAVFGVRGMGSIFYIAYAQTHADFADIDAVWRIGALVILLSIVLHGFGAAIWMPSGVDEQREPPAEADPESPVEGDPDYVGDGDPPRAGAVPDGPDGPGGAAPSADGGASRERR